MADFHKGLITARLGLILTGLALLTGGCEANVSAENTRLKRENERMAAELAVHQKLASESDSIPEISTPRAGADDDPPMDDGPSPELEERLQARIECWQDYCPCEPDPDNSSVETMHCDLFRIGRPRPEEELVLAKALRNARREQRQWDRENPDF